MITFLPEKTKPKPAYQTLVREETRHSQPCERPRAHQAFWYFRADSQEAVCDVCNWESAFMGEAGHLWCYPEKVREPLRQALERRGITPHD